MAAVADHGVLDGVVTVVTNADAPRGRAVALALAAAGTPALMLCGDDGACLGALAAEVEALGAQAALFLGDVERDASELIEMTRELFLARTLRSARPGSAARSEHTDSPPSA